MKLIGLSGVKESGKSTAFDYIKNQIDGVVEIQLAKKLKDTCSVSLNIPRSHFDDQDFKEKTLVTPLILTKETITNILCNYQIDFSDKYLKHIGKQIKTPREAAQYIGTEVLREGDPDIHCRHAIIEAEKLGARVGIITDMRFPNELDFFCGDNEFLGGFFIYRPEKYNQLLSDMAKGNVHSSETNILYLVPRMTIIDNDSNLVKLQDQINKKILIKF